MTNEARPVSKEHIIDGHELTFDPGHDANGSLYLCRPRSEVQAAGVTSTVAALRRAGLWSDVEPKQVPDGQREAYKAQLELVATELVETAGGPLRIARFDHPKFPSNAERWAQWCAFFGR